MSIRALTHCFGLLAFTVLSLAAWSGVANAKEILIADRLSNNVFRYSTDGTYLGTLVEHDPLNPVLNQPTGIAVSPDMTKLYVSNFQTQSITQFDYDYAAGTATNPTVFATAGLLAPSTIRFSQDGTKMLVSNLGGTGVAQFNLDGSSAGPAINGLVAGGSVFQFSGMAFAPNGDLLVGGFQDFPAGTSGAVARSNNAITTLGDFIGPSSTINGASGLLVHGDDLYVVGMFSSNITRYNANTGAVDSGFGITDLAFPQDIMASPDGNGFLVGVLGYANGTGNILQYGFDGTLIGEFASSADGIFTEATAFTVVPEPSSVVLIGLGLAAVAVVARGRTRRSA